MSGSLTIESTARGDVAYVRLIGDLNNSFDAAQLLDAAVGDDLVLDFGDVTSVDAAGVQRWKKTLPALQKKAKRVIFVECSPAVVSELNADGAFVGKGALVSVRAPFRCEVCDTEMEVTIDADAAATDTLPAAACDNCSADMVLDEDSGAYFEFTSKIPPASVDAKLRRTIDQLTTMAEAPGDLPSEPSMMPSETTEPKEHLSDHDSTVEDRAVKPPDEIDDEEDFDDSFDEPTGEMRRQPREDITSVAEARGPSRSPAMEPTRVRNDDTDPALKQIRRKKKRSIGDTMASITGRFAEVPRPPPLGIAIAGAAMGVLLAIAWLVTPSGVPADELLAFHQHLARSDYAAAEQVLETLNESMPEELSTIFSQQIVSARGQSASQEVAKSMELFEQRKFQKALEHASAALKMGGESADALFVGAESARRIPKKDQSDDYYARFIESFPKDRRFDDALFWLGESEFSRGNVDKARALFARVIAAPKSNYKRSATRRLQEMEGN